MQHRKVIILGSTGSIGTQAIDVVDRAKLPDGAPRFSVTAISAGGGNLQLLAQQAVHLRVLAVGTAADDAGTLRSLIEAAAAAAGLGDFTPEIFTGPDASTVIAAWGAGSGDGADVVLNGITGSIGLAPTLAALATPAILALANKESLIVGGALVKDAASPGQLVPVDSEHSALAQALRSGSAGEVDKLIVTASGGPFRGCSREELADVTPAQALKHPTWDMGMMVTTTRQRWSIRALKLSKPTCSSMFRWIGSRPWCIPNLWSIPWCSSPMVPLLRRPRRRTCASPLLWVWGGRIGFPAPLLRVTGAKRQCGLLSHWITWRFPPSNLPRRRPGGGAPALLCTTQPMRRRSMPSMRGG